jgi:hypothetical protein
MASLLNGSLAASLAPLPEVRLHCIPAEDLLPQRMLKESWDEDKAYLTLKKYVHNSRRVG